MGLLLDFLRAFIALFVAIDIPAILPIFLSLTEEMEGSERWKTTLYAVAVAGAAGVLFLWLGRPILNLMGITVPDFRVGGGLIILALAINDLVIGKERRRAPAHELGPVPLGIPLVVGPAALTTLLGLGDTYSKFLVLGAFAANMVVVLLAFASGTAILRALGRTGAKALSKVMMIILAAIAVAMIRAGVSQMSGGFGQ